MEFVHLSSECCKITFVAEESSWANITLEVFRLCFAFDVSRSLYRSVSFINGAMMSIGWIMGLWKTYTIPAVRISFEWCSLALMVRWLWFCDEMSEVLIWTFFLFSGKYQKWLESCTYFVANQIFFKLSSNEILECEVNFSWRHNVLGWWVSMNILLWGFFFDLGVTSEESSDSLYLKSVNRALV